MLWQRPKVSKLRRSDWMHCLTYLDYSNSNQQRKKPRKLHVDVKNTGRLAHTTTSCQRQFSVGHTLQPRPTRTLSTAHKGSPHNIIHSSSVFHVVDLVQLVVNQMLQL